MDDKSIMFEILKLTRMYKLACRSHDEESSLKYKYKLEEAKDIYNKYFDTNVNLTYIGGGSYELRT